MPSKRSVWLGAIGGGSVLAFLLLWALRSGGVDRRIEPGGEARREDGTGSSAPATGGAGVGRPKVPETAAPFSPQDLSKALASRIDPKRAKTFQSQVLDEAAAPYARMEALLHLWIQAPDYRTPEVVSSMIRLLHASPNDVNLRSGILRGLRGITSEDLKSELILRLKTDGSRAVREAAVFCLAGLRDDRTVHAELQTAAQADPDPSVRKHAAEVLKPSR